MVDFIAKEDLVNVKGGKAYVALRFLCLPGHHGTDEEYQCANTTTSKSVAYSLQIDCCDIELWPNFRAAYLYRYYTLSVDMGTDLLGDMVKPCQGHMSPRSLDNPPLVLSATGTHLSHSGFSITGDQVREQVPCSLSCSLTG